MYEGGTNWTRLNTTAGRFVSTGTASINEIESIVVYNGALYFGTTETNLAEVYRYDGAAFTKITDATAGTVASGGTAAIDSISSLGVYNGRLFLGTNETGDAEVYRYNGGTSWTAIGTGSPGEFTVGSEQYDKVHSMAIYHGQLYIGMDDPADAVVYRYDGGITWTQITDPEAGTIVSGDTIEITEIRSLTVFNDTLIAGTAKSNAAEIYQYRESEGQSYALKFAGNSDYVTPQTGVVNEATISFLGEQQANSNRGNDGGGQFLFSHGLVTATGA